MMPPVYYSAVESPIGLLLLTSDGEAITGLYMENHRAGPGIAPHWVRADEPFAAARAQLAAYFAGERTAFDLPLRAPGGTPFQRRVWDALQEIPFGETVSYSDLARSIGRPRAVRATGSANARNPISIFVPCHRVVGAGGALTGYGGGIDRKRALLELERRVRAANP
ncbi:MAG TPA: methylated-DNA--[protein]-cysteine S-methyltransferase [Longimicrobium sp.]